MIIARSVQMVGMVTLKMVPRMTVDPVHALVGRSRPISSPRLALQMKLTDYRPVTTAHRVPLDETVKCAWMDTLGGRG